jgi:hypothetical protein
MSSSSITVALVSAALRVGYLTPNNSPATIMSKIDCRAGNTQISKIISHVKRENRTLKVSAATFVGDAMEEKPEDLYDASAGLGVPVFLF